MPQPLISADVERTGETPVRVPPPRRPTGRRVDAHVEPPPLPNVPGTGRSPTWNRVSAAGISGLIHAALLLALALVVLHTERAHPPAVLTLIDGPASENLPQQLLVTDVMDPVDAVEMSTDSRLQLDSELIDEVSEIPLATDVSAAAVKVRLSDFADQTVPRSDLMRDVAAFAGRALEGRGERQRGEMVAKYGGSAGSERAVAMALKWFAAHQQSDGSWTLDLNQAPCKGTCSQPGRLDGCATGATALALLPFSGAGQTHEQGQYKENVYKGLRYLLRVQDRRTGHLVSGGGSLYSHGLSTIVLCEAYAMTQDEFLRQPAQSALNYTAAAQHLGGGWRYLPQQPGDTSAVAWQLMAMKSGHMGRLEVPSQTIQRVTRFLDTVQSDGGALYGYNSRLPRPSTTAAGLLCRMYLGWKHDEAALARGIRHLSDLGPAASEETAKYHMYYNYYATQVMRHFGGEPWEIWNAVLRDQLVKSQVTTGHMAGSWTVPDWEHAEHDTEMGGRLYYTALATMILEVYYRYMPIYGETATDEFPL